MLLLNLHDVPTLQKFGNTVALGVILALLLSLTLIPALVVMLQNSFQHGRIGAQSERTLTYIQSFCLWVSTLTTLRRPLITMSTLMIIIILCAGIFENRIHEVITHSFDKQISFRKANDIINDKVTGLHQIDIAITLPEPNTALEPNFIALLERATYWVEQQPEVAHVDSIVRPIKQIHTHMTDRHDLPTSRAAISQYLLVYSLGLPTPVLLDQQINQQRNATLISARLWESSTTELLAVEERIQSWFANQSTPINFNVEISSIDLIFGHIVTNNIIHLLLGTLVALTLIALLMMILFRSKQLGLFCTMTNLLPYLLVLGLWGYVSGHIGLSIASVGTLCLGLVVDDTIHLMHRYQRHLSEYRTGHSTEHRTEHSTEAHLQSMHNRAIQQAIIDVGPALIITSLIFIAGFSVLLFSQYNPSVIFGAVLSLTLLAALIVDLLIVPNVISRMAERKERHMNRGTFRRFEHLYPRKNNNSNLEERYDRYNKKRNQHEPF